MMKTLTLLPALVLAGTSIMAFPAPEAEARGGLNASYARAYCEYYRNKAAIAARKHSDVGLASRQSGEPAQSQSPEYWRAKYRACLKEYGF